MSVAAVAFDAAAIRAVLFDLDGTLLDTVADLAAAVNLMRADFGLQPLPEATIAGFVGKGADVLVHRAMTGVMDGRLEAGRFTPARAAFQARYLQQNGVAAVVYPGVLDGLEALHRAGFPMACVTNKPQVFTDPLLERHGLQGYFRHVLGGDALPRKKPDPLPLLHLAGLLGLEPGQCLMVGDSLNDAQAARAAQMPVVLVPYGYNEGRDVATIDSDGIVSTVQQIAGMLASA